MIVVMAFCVRPEAHAFPGLDWIWKLSGPEVQSFSLQFEFCKNEGKKDLCGMAIGAPLPADEPRTWDPRFRLAFGHSLQTHNQSGIDSEIKVGYLQASVAALKKTDLCFKGGKKCMRVLPELGLRQYRFYGGSFPSFGRTALLVGGLVRFPLSTDEKMQFQVGLHGLYFENDIVSQDFAVTPPDSTGDEWVGTLSMAIHLALR